MTVDPFWWLRLLLALLVSALSVVFGLEPGTDPRTASVGDLLGLLVQTAENGIEARGGLDEQAEAVDQAVEQSARTDEDALDEIEDEPLDEIVDGPLTVLPPLDDETEDPGDPNDTAPGVVGGGVSEGPVGEGPTPPTPTIPPPAPPAPTTEGTATFPPAPATATPPAAPTRTPAPTATATATESPTTTPTATPDPAALRLDDQVLRWLPELRSASQATGVPLALLAAVVRVESGGDPNLVAADGGRGLTGIPPDSLATQGVPSGSWHDPATNLLAGARWLAGLAAAAGAWDAALRQVWGPGCDALGQCAGLYAYAVLAWEPVYSPLVANPATSGIPSLPSAWTPPPVAPYQESAPRAIPLPPGVPPPTPTAPPTPPATETPVPTETPLPTETPVPTEPPLPTETPVPTEIPLPTEPPATPDG